MRLYIFLFKIYFHFSTRKSSSVIDTTLSPSYFSLHAVRSGPREPARWSLHKRTPSAQSHPAQDSGDGPSRDTTVRHLPTAARVARMRVQNFMQVPGDGIHSARCYWWQQTQGRTSPRPSHVLLVLNCRLLLNLLESSSQFNISIWSFANKVWCLT